MSVVLILVNLAVSREKAKEKVPVASLEFLSTFASLLLNKCCTDCFRFKSRWGKEHPVLSFLNESSFTSVLLSLMVPYGSFFLFFSSKTWTECRENLNEKQTVSMPRMILLKLVLISVRVQSIVIVITTLYTRNELQGHRVHSVCLYTRCTCPSHVCLGCFSWSSHSHECNDQKCVHSSSQVKREMTGILLDVFQLTWLELVLLSFRSLTDCTCVNWFIWDERGSLFKSSLECGRTFAVSSVEGHLLELLCFQDSISVPLLPLQLLYVPSSCFT